ncbi:MAG: DDE-type integrase/transposase/recombinase [Clostridium sp.]
MNKKKENYLKSIYYNTKKPGSFSGVNKLTLQIKKENKFKFSQAEIKKWLQSQEVHTTNRLVHRKFNRKQVIAPYIDYMWDADTASFINYANKNDKYGHFVLAIDIMSRFIWTKAVKTPSGNETKKAFEVFFKKGRIPERLRSDKGSEFLNDKMEKLYENFNIKHFVTQNELKANYAERGIQTLKAKLIRYMRSKQTHRWIDELDNITSTYNNTVHRSIKQTPASVTKADEIKLWRLLYTSKKQLTPPKSFKFDINDTVRISKIRKPFHRYYSEHWTNEFFYIKGRSMYQYIPIYTLADYYGDKILGTFYEKELQQVYVDKNTTYNIEEVKDERINNRKKESLIKWWGWPTKFDSWILTKDIINFKKV